MAELPLVVVVDDDIDYRQILSDLLATLPARVESFDNRADALAFLRDHVPQLIVTDLMMDSLTAGFDFARQVRADARLAAVPLVMMTGIRGKLGFDFAPQSPADIAAMRIDAYFEKPPQAGPFLKRVRELIEQ